MTPKDLSIRRGIIFLLATVAVAWAGGDLRAVGVTGWDSYSVRIVNLMGINAVLAMSLNLINGFTGQFSLGHAGFMAVGAYTTALLTMDPVTKKMVYFMTPIIPPLQNLTLPFIVALLFGGAMAALFAAMVGVPSLQLRGDYLAIATLGFAEIIRLVIQNAQVITNGALGLKGIPAKVNLWWTIGVALCTYVLLRNLLQSSFGRALRSIRENETAAQAMGINLFRHKMISFLISSFVAGVGGGLLASLLTTIDPVMFKFPLTFQILLTVVLGGMGSLSGSVLAAAIVTYLMEFLRIVEEPRTLGFLTIPGIPGLRMVIFSFALVIVVIWYPRGLLGDGEFSVGRMLNSFRRMVTRRRAAV